MRYEAKSHLLGKIPDSGARKVFKPGDILTESDLKDAGFDKDVLLNTENSPSYKPGFPASIKPIRGTEDAPVAPVPVLTEAGTPASDDKKK